MKNKESTFVFRILKSSWGIYLKIKGSSSSIEINSNIGHTISDNISLNIATDNLVFSDQEIQFIKNGLLWVSPQIESRIQRPILITISHIDISMCDYQSEGLYYGIASWAANHFSFDMPTYEWSYNKEMNKYIFPDLVI